MLYCQIWHSQAEILAPPTGWGQSGAKSVLDTVRRRSQRSEVGSQPSPLDSQPCCSRPKRSSPKRTRSARTRKPLARFLWLSTLDPRPSTILDAAGEWDGGGRRHRRVRRGAGTHRIRPAVESMHSLGRPTHPTCCVVPPLVSRRQVTATVESPAYCGGRPSFVTLLSGNTWINCERRSRIDAAISSGGLSIEQDAKKPPFACPRATEHWSSA